MHGEVGEEGFDLGGAHFPRVASVMEEDVALDPADVGFLSAWEIVFESNGFVDRVEQSLGMAVLIHSALTCPNRHAIISEDLERSVDMSKNVYMVIFFLLMITIIVGVDVLFLRKYLVARLIVNIGIVVAFASFYFIFLKDL
jgi:hypothetical protein